MPRVVRNLNSQADMRQYIRGAHERANHHGPTVDAIWPCVLGYVQCYGDQLPFMVRSSRDGNGMANQAWVRFRGQLISFSYDHEEKKIAVRQGHRVLAMFDNSTKPSQLLRFFKNLVA